jgi:hypothetical protein
VKLADLSWSIVLSAAAIVIEILFIPWHLITLWIIGRAVRDPQTGKIEPVTLGLFLLVLLWAAQTGITILLLYRLAIPLDLLVALLVLDALLIAARTYFMWHLQLKVLVKEWLNR